MRWINFPDGSRYTFAVDIQKFAEKNGYAVPCEQDGTRHPGTDCNQKMRVIFKDTSVRRAFGIVEQSVVEVRVADAPMNASFIRWLVDNSIVSNSYLRKDNIQLYTKEAVNALLSKMLGIYVEYEADDDDEEWDCAIFVTKRSHNLEKKRNKPKASLFNK